MLVVASVKTLTAVLDLQFTPVSYDAVTWLVRAMLERDERKCGALHVVISPLEGGFAGFARGWGKHDEAATRWRFQHIVVPACWLAGATVTVAANKAQAILLAEHADECWWPDGKAHFMGPLVDAARAGKAIPKLRATDEARRRIAQRYPNRDIDPIVTLTLRHQDTDSDRNSNAAEWDKFCAWLEDYDLKYQFVVLEDVNDTLRTGETGLDIDLRLALYEQAAMNLIGNNGPQELLKFSDAPYLAFGQGLGGWESHFRKYFHMEPGDQLPWARADQRLVYAPDTFDVMRGEFEKLEASRALVTRSS